MTQKINLNELPHHAFTFVLPDCEITVVINLYFRSKTAYYTNLTYQIKVHHFNMFKVGLRINIQNKPKLVTIMNY